VLRQELRGDLRLCFPTGMKPIAAALLCVIVVGVGVAPIVAGCSDEKSGAPPTSPTSVAGKQTFSSGDGGSGAGTGPVSPGGW
jgi:hypothetical protein